MTTHATLLSPSALSHGLGQCAFICFVRGVALEEGGGIFQLDTFKMYLALVDFSKSTYPAFNST